MREDPYDCYDEIYREVWGSSLHHGLWPQADCTREQALENLRDLVLSELNPHGRIADIGCGYGELAQVLVDRFDCEVLANTSSKVQQARIPNHPRIESLPGNWTDQVLPPDSLDGAVALESLSHFPSFETFVRHTAETLKIGSSLVIADWFSDEGDRLLLRHLANLGRIPPWRSINDLIAVAQRHGLRPIHSVDLSREVAPTWSRLFQRACFLPFRKPRLISLLVRQALQSPGLLWSFPLLRLAYQNGSLEYHLVAFKK
ncbi:MAG: methyltransferase domain-containing protein [Akkermansiaceae bacterium]|jgi:sarcosine/dimethylglycine N-methyltransferase